MEKRISFVLNADTINESLSILTDKDSGVLFRAILYYLLKEENPTIESELVLQCFNKLKEDIDKATESRIRKAEAAKSNAEKRWNKNANASKKDANALKNDATASILDANEKTDVVEVTPVKVVKPKEFDLSFVAPEYLPQFKDWLAYKKERKQTYTQIGAKQCYSKLLRISGNNPDTARQIIEESIANNYQGLFPLKTNNYGDTKFERQVRSQQQLGQALAEQCARQIAEESAGRSSGESQFHPPSLFECE